MPIGMSSGMAGSIWNPRAKGPLQIQNNNMPMSPMPMMNQNPQPMSPMMRQQAGGMMPNYPPIAPSRNMLNKHMALPTPDTGAEVNGTGAMPRQQRRPMGVGIPMRRIF